ncbi:acetyl-CoA carboxylase biotin carboxyl carrier protein subunit [Cupriavidus sp. TA19]|uniref:biotin/lipoyl-binding carrier protein n=1 Tax=unclassified Cupriavidus TaxID=2640874 RepID=UPI000E2EC9DE|nr:MULTISPECIES: biotin/lipoyl-binding carrier protein [unclassified Cupriavidus]BDB30688.1 biotin/lipoyl-binding carrier protein [Cupriavidus sp. P-10]GLC91762.1 acetyl-CoA carboxylase biotin carboxyl carrier protein subunit [Cupriavidus sp. TA19]
MSIKVKSEVVGSVWKCECEIGQTVTEGDVLFIIESMKMEIPVEAMYAGTVSQVLVKEGEPIAEGQVMAVVDPA